MKACFLNSAHKAWLIVFSLFVSSASQAQTWSGIGQGIDSAAGPLFSDSNDSILYIGTLYDCIDLSHLPGAVTWNGSDLEEIPDYINGGGTLSITQFDEYIYFGGGLVCLPILSRWDGMKWSTVPDTSEKAIVGPSVGTLNVYHDNLYAFGNFALYNDVKSMAKFDGEAWSYIGDSLELNGLPWTSKVFKDKLYIGGGNLTFDTLLAYNVATWNDTVFQAHPIPGDFCTVSSFTVLFDTLYCSTLCGNVYKLNDSIWEFIIGADSFITAIEGFEGKLFIGGEFSKIGNTSANYIGYLHNNSIYGMSGGTNGPVYDIEVYKNNVYVAGKFSKAGNKTVNNLARWGSPIGIDETSFPPAGVNVRPNPIQENSVIELLSVTDAIVHVSIFSMTGSLIYESDVSHINQFPLGNILLNKGVYCYHVLTENGSSYAGRIVK